MNVTFTSKGDFENTAQWLKRLANNSPEMALTDIGEEGKNSLSSNTPKDTGETASGWEAKVTTKKHISEVTWYNTAHPETRVNLAKLIDAGHGTGTGGYVPAKPFIVRSMDSIWKTAGDKIAEELVK